MLRVASVLLSLGVSFSVGALSPPPPILPPVNWEAEADPRFDPPVEEVVLALATDYSEVNEEEFGGYWAAWGVEALEALLALEKRPAWEPFRAKIFRVFYLCPLDEGLPVLQAELARQGDGVVGAVAGSKESNEFARHLELAKARSPELLTPLLDHKDDLVRYMAASRLNQDAETMSSKVLSVLEDFAASESPESREYAVGLLHTIPNKENYDRAARIAETVSPDFLHKTREYQAQMAPVLRAREPMALILEQEGH